MPPAMMRPRRACLNSTSGSGGAVAIRAAGVRQSRPKSLRGFSASVEYWGSKDCAAALEWIAIRFPGARRIVIGHSVGGFVTGFVTNGHRIDRMLLVGAHTGYWRDYAARAR